MKRRVHGGLLCELVEQFCCWLNQSGSQSLWNLLSSQASSFPPFCTAVFSGWGRGEGVIVSHTCKPLHPRTDCYSHHLLWLNVLLCAASSSSHPFIPPPPPLPFFSVCPAGSLLSPTMLGFVMPSLDLARKMTQSTRWRPRPHPLHRGEKRRLICRSEIKRCNQKMHQVLSTSPLACLPWSAIWVLQTLAADPTELRESCGREKFILFTSITEPANKQTSKLRGPTGERVHAVKPESIFFTSDSGFSKNPVREYLSPHSLWNHFCGSDFGL